MASQTSSEPKTIEEFIGSFDLERQKEYRMALTQVYNLIGSWTPETRGDKVLLAFMFLKRGIEPALQDRPFDPTDDAA